MLNIWIRSDNTHLDDIVESIKSLDRYAKIENGFFTTIESEDLIGYVAKGIEFDSDRLPHDGYFLNIGTTDGKWIKINIEDTYMIMNI